MPELPEVETIKEGLQILCGRCISSVARSDYKFRIESNIELPKLVGFTILEVRRKARYLLIDVKQNGKEPMTIIFHLGMTGKLLFCDFCRKLEKHDHLTLNFTDGSCLIFNDIRRFGFVDLIPSIKINTYQSFARFGPEPLSEDFNVTYSSKFLKEKSSPIKIILMDNAFVVGVGNIYANEALFDAKISPIRQSKSLNHVELKSLVKSVKKIIDKAIKAKGSSISDYVDSGGNKGNFQDTFMVYGKENKLCKSCDEPIIKVVQAGRSSFFCKKCQH